MLTFNLRSILVARGIERHYTFLVKAGFAPSTAHNLLNNNTTTFRLNHIEKLCTILNCTPNDLLAWSKNNNEILNEDHSLTTLIKQNPTQSWLQTLKTVSYQDLKLLSDIINNYKK